MFGDHLIIWRESTTTNMNSLYLYFLPLLDVKVSKFERLSAKVAVVYPLPPQGVKTEYRLRGQTIKKQLIRDTPLLFEPMEKNKSQQPSNIKISY